MSFCGLAYCIDLSCLSSVRILELCAGYCDKDASPFMVRLTHVLATISSPGLHRLVLHMIPSLVSWQTVTHDSVSTGPPSVLALHGVLKKPVFDGLKEVRVIVHQQKVPEVHAVLGMWLSPWMARGIMLTIWTDETGSPACDPDKSGSSSMLAVVGIGPRNAR